MDGLALETIDDDTLLRRRPGSNPHLWYDPACMPVFAKALSEAWDLRAIPIPLKVLASPYREITRPVLDYVKSIRRSSPRDVVTVYIPEYVLGHWWEQLLHNQSALRLKGRLLFTPGVMVTSVPWQLRSSELAAAREDGPAPGQVRRGG